MSFTGSLTSEMPTVQVLAGFGATNNSLSSFALSPGWTDISAYVRSGTISRSSNRIAGPIYQYQAGTLSLALKNADARFDPENLSGPYVTTVGVQSVTEVITPATFGGDAVAPLPQPGGTQNQVAGAWTAPVNLNGTTVSVQCWGGGGGGGTGSQITLAAAGGGGGGGEYAAEQALAVTAGSTYQLLIGQAGRRGTVATRTGEDAGDTVFHGDSVNVIAHGGRGGQTGTASGSSGSAKQTQGAGGAGGTGSANTQNNPGGAGGSGGQNGKGNRSSGGSGGGSGGNGNPGNAGNTGNGNTGTRPPKAVSGGGPGGAGGGPPAQGTTQPNNGSPPAAAPGGGGGGGAGEANGGSGAPGQIIITYTIITAASARTEVLPEVPIRVIGAYARNGTVSFENGTGNWGAFGGASLTADASQAGLWGSTALLITPGGQANPGAQSELLPVYPGETQVSGSAWAFTPGGIPGTVRLDIAFYDVNQALLSTDAGTATALPAGAWTNVVNLGNAVPQGTVYFQVKLRLSGTPGAGTSLVWMDQAVGAPGANAGAFPLFTGYADAWTDAGIMNPNDPDQPAATAGLFQGTAETSLTATDAFEVLALAALGTVASPIDSGNDAGGRVSVILDAIGWPPDLRNLDPSPIIVQGTDLGDDALTEMQNAVLADGGDLFMDELGNVTFFTRNHVLSSPSSTTVQAVLGDRPGTVQPDGTELPYSAITRVTDNTTMFNDVQLTQQGGVDPNGPTAPRLQEATDPASIAQFLFVRSYQNTSTLHMFKADALALAQWILYIAKDSESRVDQLVISPQHNPADLFTQVLGLSFTDEIELWRRPAGMLSAIVKRLGIRGISHQWDFSAKTWQTTWSLQDYAKYNSFLRLDDDISGRLGYNALAFDVGGD